MPDQAQELIGVIPRSSKISFRLYRNISFSKAKVRREYVIYSLKESGRTREASGSVQEQTCEEPKAEELSQEHLHQMIMVILVEEVYVEALQVKYPIIDWEIYSEDTRKYWKIIRVGGNTKAYQNFNDMLKKFDKDDLDKLWNLVKERFRTIEPTEDKAREL
ncbi:hypothetical protein Tco_0211770 [Tanacetum coccineum]